MPSASGKDRECLNFSKRSKLIFSRESVPHIYSGILIESDPIYTRRPDNWMEASWVVIE
jgi:hypothetical protein